MENHKIPKSQPTARDAGRELRFELYKEAMRVLEREGHYAAWKGWDVIRAIGKDLLGRWDAHDADCAEAVILFYKRPKKKKT